jgi:hypothetical protein
MIKYKQKEVYMFKSVKFYNEEFCLKNKDALIVFGDNLIKKGKAGQNN